MKKKCDVEVTFIILCLFVLIKIKKNQKHLARWGKISNFAAQT